MSFHLFSAHIAPEGDLNDYKHISSLKIAMQDPDAKSIVHLHASNGRYKVIVEALQECYDKSKLVTSTLRSSCYYYCSSQISMTAWSD